MTTWTWISSRGEGEADLEAFRDLGTIQYEDVPGGGYRFVIGYFTDRTREETLEALRARGHGAASLITYRDGECLR